jgi:hypothetical protein
MPVYPMMNFDYAGLSLQMSATAEIIINLIALKIL